MKVEIIPLALVLIVIDILPLIFFLVLKILIFLRFILVIIKQGLLLVHRSYIIIVLGAALQSLFKRGSIQAAVTVAMA